MQAKMYILFPGRLFVCIYFYVIGFRGAQRHDAPSEWKITADGTGRLALVYYGTGVFCPLLAHVWSADEAVRVSPGWLVEE